MIQQNISLENLAVLVIDMQDNFLTHSSKYLIPNHVSMLRFCNKNNIPVINIEVIGGRHTTRTTEKLMLELKKLPPQNLFWISKDNLDAFSSKTNLDSILKSLDVKTLLLMGVNAGVCVLKTAQTALRYDYQIITSKDLIAGYSKWEKDEGKDDSWYRKNTLYFNNHKQIIGNLVGEF